MAGLAMAFGGTSYVAGNHWLDNAAQARLNEIESQARPEVELATLVVTTEQLRFGAKIEREKLKEVPWPKDAMPAGAFTNIDELVDNGDRKAIKTIESGEPVTSSKLTGVDAKAGLAGLISDGMRAVTIPVDMVNGVGGFVQPGDRVDIVLTQRDRDEGEQTAKILMENVKVLSIDQEADTRTEVARVAQTVTLETDAEGAQRLALSTSLGRLSLLLRGAGDDTELSSSSMSGENIHGKQESNEKADAGILSIFAQPEKTTTIIRVVKREDAIELVVPILKKEEQKNAAEASMN